MSISNIKICRACLAKCPEDEVAFETLKNVFLELTLLQDAPSIELPRFLCGKCGELLRQFKTFKETCIESDTHFRKAASNSNFPLLPVELIKIESKVFDDDDVSLNLSPASSKRKRTATKSTDPGINRHRTRAKQKNSKKQRIVESSNESENLEEYKPGQDIDRRKTRAKQIKSSAKVQSFNESVKQDDEISVKKQGGTDTSDDNDEEYNAEPQIKEKRSQQKGKSKVGVELPFSCTKPKCGKKFQFEHWAEAHIKKHDGIDPKICDICERPLTSVRNMVRHRLTHNSLEERLHRCQVCYKVMSSGATLMQHMKTHEARRFVCDVCGLGCVSNSALKAHKNTHNTDLSFKCNLCPKSYTAYATLFMHIKTKHHDKKEESAQCLICGQVVASKKFLFSHCRNKHTVYTTTENVYQCKQCDLKCKSTRSLKRHEELHTGERKYKCPLCPKAYAHYGILKKHSYTHTGERPVHCEECGKGFLHKYSLDVHMNVHKKQWIAQGVPGISLSNYKQPKKVVRNTCDSEFGDNSADSAVGFMGIDQPS